MQGTDRIEGRGGNDLIGIGIGDARVTTAEGDDFVYSVSGGGGNNGLVLGEGDDNVFLESGNYTIGAGTGNDVLGLGTGTALVRSSGGNNIIYKAATGENDGNKDIITGAGNDYMELGSGDDVIDGGGGVNTLFGGAGADTFTFRRGAYNFIGDFELGSDKIQLADVQMRQLSFFAGTNGTTDSVFIFIGREALGEVVGTTVAELQSSANFV